MSPELIAVLQHDTHSGLREHKLNELHAPHENGNGAAVGAGAGAAGAGAGAEGLALDQQYGHPAAMNGAPAGQPAGGMAPVGNLGQSGGSAGMGGQGVAGQGVGGGMVSDEQRVSNAVHQM